MKFSIFAWALALGSLVQAQNPWQAENGLTSDQYQSTFNSLVSQGYRLNYVSGYTINNEPAFAAIWEKKSSPAWVANHGMTADQFQQKFNTYVAQGYRLVLVNGYTVNGEDNYVAIWDKSPSGEWVARNGMSSSDYQTAFNTYVGQGYRLMHVSGYAVGNEARYAAIWEKTDDGVAWVSYNGMTAAAYQQQFNTLVGQGYRLVLVNGYQVDNFDYYVAIWDKSPSGPWVAHHGMTSSEYQAQFDNNYYQGYMLKTISGYDLGPSVLYAALWENDVMSATDLNTIDTDINAYISNHSIPGLSVAITKDDRLVFAKGYGLADEASNTPVTPISIFRIMSISKSFTATAIMTLVQQGHFNITDRVFGPGSLLGDKYGTIIVNGQKQYKPGVTSITVQNLLEHTAGWGGDADPENLLKTETPAQAVSSVLDTVALATPPNTVFFYSNFGFLILGRIVADISGTDYETFVQKNILKQSGITTMQLANDAGPVPNEVTYYPLGVTNGFRIHEFDSFGGWVSNPINIMRFSTHVDGLAPVPDILSVPTETQMWTASALNGGYGKGWIVNQPWRGHNGAFGGTGAFFVERTDGMGFAVTMNTNAVGDGDSWALEAVLDAMITKVSAWPAYDLF